jgi:hypothetical protein
MWRALSKEARAPYVQLSDADKERFEKDMKIWRAKSGMETAIAQPSPAKRKREDEEYNPL